MSSFEFVEKVMCINDGGNNPPTFQFYKKGFVIGSGKVTPDWKDITIKGIGALTLVNAKAESLEYLKLFGDTELLPETYLDTVTLSGGCEQRNLPVGYTQLQYLEVETSGAYFSTGINATIDTDMGVTASNITSDSAHILVAQCISGSDYFRIAKAGASKRIIGRLGSSTVTDNNTDGVSKFTARMNKSGFYVNGSLVGTFSSVPQSLTGIGVVDIFSGKYSETVYYAYPGSRFYSAWVDDNIFLPCRRNSDNQLGIYNTKTGQFILPSGTGSFIAGPDLVPSPDTPMDIVCNNGAIRVSINEFDVNAITSGYFYNADLVWTANQSVYTTDYMKTVKGKYTLILGKVASLQTSILNVRVNLFNANKEIQSQNVIPIAPNTTEYTYEVDIPDGISYVRISINPTYFVVSSFSNSKTIYTDGTVEQVTDSLGNTASAEMLLNVGSIYKDTQEVLTGNITRRCGIKVLNGTETVTKTTSSTAPLGYYFGVETGTPHASSVAFGFCTNFTVTANNAQSLSDNTFALGSTASQKMWFATSKFTEASDFKQWLADQYANGTPVIIVYPLATATTSTVTGQFLSKSPVTQTAGAISNLGIAETSSSHTTPTPLQPLDINCNNGVLGIDSQGNITVTGTTETVEIDTTGDTATAEMLLKVGTYQDVQSVIDGGVTRNVGILVLDGTENWGYESQYSRFSITFTPASIVQTTTRSIPAYCTHFEMLSNGEPISDITPGQGYVAKNSNNNYSMLYFHSNITTQAGFKQYIEDQYNAGTPVIIVYPLATPTTETVTAQPMNIQEGTNTVTITQASMDDLELEVKYKAGVAVTIEEIQNAQLDNNVEVIING